VHLGLLFQYSTTAIFDKKAGVRILQFAHCTSLFSVKVGFPDSPQNGHGNRKNFIGGGFLPIDGGVFLLDKLQTPFSSFQP
jgi:hypothetical protein